MATITGKFVNSLPLVEGNNNGRDWARGGLVIETIEDYPKYVALTIFGRERLKLLQGINTGDIILVTYAPESKQVGDRWYTDLKCLTIQRTIKISEQ